MASGNGTRSRRKSAALALLVLAVFTAVTVVLTWPLVTDMSSQFFNPDPSHDGVGTIAETWYTNYAREQGLESGDDNFRVYPFGLSAGNPKYPLTNGLMEAIARVSDAQTGYNWLMFVSFPMAGLFMYLLLDAITHSFWASFLGGFIYAFSPWHVFRSFDQPSLGQIYLLPLFLLAVIRLWRKRDVVSAAAVGAVMLLAVLTDFHLALFCAFLGVAWCLAAVLASRSRGDAGGGRPSEWIDRQALRAAALGVAAVLAAVAISAPLLATMFGKDPQAMTTTSERTIEETSAYSSRPWNYVVPPAYALVWRSSTRGFVTGHLGKSGVHEVTAYPGIVTAALAACGVLFTFRKKKRTEVLAEEAVEEPPAPNGPTEDSAPDDPGDHGGAAGRTNPAGRASILEVAVYFGIAATAIGFILSMPPLVKIGGVELPTPSIVMRALAPFFRFYSRWALVVNFALVLLAAVGFLRLTGMRWLRGRRAAAFCLGLIALFALDTTIVPPLRSRDITEVPQAVRALEKEPGAGPVAFYPMSPERYFIPMQYYYYQTFARKPMLNGASPGTRASLYQAVLKDLYSPYTPGMLAGLGIKKVVVFPEYFKIMFPAGLDFDPTMMPEGYSHSRKFDDSFIYDVTGPATHVFPLYYANLSTPSILEDGAAWTVMMRPTCEILLENDGGDAEGSFHVTFHNNGAAGTLTTELDGQTLGSLTLPHGRGVIALPGLRLGNGRHTLTLAWNGPARRIAGDAFPEGGELDEYLLLSRPGFTEAKQ